MDVSELAEELYDLIVVKGRWGGRRSTGGLNNGYSSNPQWIKDLWEDEAVIFAATHNLPLTGVTNG